MGSFDIKCSVSGFPIMENHSAVLIPIVQDEYSPKLSTKGFNRDIIVNTNDIFKFMGLGIKGTYNGYGSLEDIEMDFYSNYYRDLLLEDNETEIGEKEFMVRLKNSKKFNHFYVKREVYDFLISNHSEDRDLSILDNSEGDNEILIKVYDVLKKSSDKLKELDTLKLENPKLFEDESLLKEYFKVMRIGNVYNTLQNDTFYFENGLKSSMHFNFSYYEMEDTFLAHLMELKKEEFVNELLNLINFKYIISSLCVPIIPSIYVGQDGIDLIIKYTKQINSITDKLPTTHYPD